MALHIAPRHPNCQGFGWREIEAPRQEELRYDREVPSQETRRLSALNLPRSKGGREMQ